MSVSLPIHGRGTAENPPNRFEPIELTPDEEYGNPPDGSPVTHYYRDFTRTIIAHNDSPDVGFEFSINPYRGCEHGCIYCYARPTHEWLGLSAGLDFETKVFVKQDAPQLLRRELMSKRWQPTVLSISGVTDCYQPVERQLQITRQCLQVLLEFRNPVGLITKNHLITRDIDVLGKLAEHRCAMAILSITTLDNELARVMEPRTSSPDRRLAAVEALRNAGVPVGVMVAPVIPGLTDHELPAILKAAASAGAMFAGYVPVRLPLAVAPLFEAWLERHRPDRKDKVLNRIRSMRAGKLNDSNFHTRMRGDGAFAEQIRALFEMGRRRAGLPTQAPELSTAGFTRPGETMELFA